MNRIKVLIIALLLTLSTTNTLYADYSKKEMTSIGSPKVLGFRSDGNGIKYYYEEDKFYRDGWHWIDNNNDGIYECYYFNVLGHIYQNAITPSGYEVNDKGQLKIDGVVQHKSITEIFDMSTASQIMKKKVEVKKDINEAGKEFLSDIENDYVDILERSKEELIAKYSSRNYNRKEMKAEVSNYVDEFDKENTKYFKELRKMKESGTITKSMYDKMYNDLNKITSKYKNKLRDYINPYIDSMVNYEID